MPALTGKSDSAVTSTVPPRTLPRSGVITAKSQLIATVTVSPRPVAVPSRFTSVKVGSGTTAVPLTTGSSQLVAAESSMTWLW